MHLNQSRITVHLENFFLYESKMFVKDSTLSICLMNTFSSEQVFLQKHYLSSMYQKVYKSIAVLRVDGNFYDSYQDAMYYMYDFVSIGGIIIFIEYRSSTGETILERLQTRARSERRARSYRLP